MKKTTLQIILALAVALIIMFADSLIFPELIK
jgi:hypothetical protein